MFRGVQFFDGGTHNHGVQAVLETSSRGNVYVVDTYAFPGIQNSLDLRRALAQSMCLSEWFSYEIEALIAQALANPGDMHVLVLVISPNHRHLLDNATLNALSSAHASALTGGQHFWTFVFQNPVVRTAPSL